MVKRLLIQIDEELCNGCGNCAPRCAEGALQIIDGTARLVSEIYCDGLGACLGECSQGALSLKEEKTVEFDEEAAMEHVQMTRIAGINISCAESEQYIHAEGSNSYSTGNAVPVSNQQSNLGHWPIKL